MNPHSLSRFHFRSTLHNNSRYPGFTSHNDTLYFSPVHHTRTYNMSQHPLYHRVPHGHQQHLYQHSHPHMHMQNAPWNTATVDAPPVLQKVYILDCKSCNNFLTNRGMMAVLLLQPDVPLYSTDALPVNCSATPGPLEHAPSYETITALSPLSSCPSGMPALPRTCECLTQTLCCHGCGNTVGYMVVIPCNRCTSSVSPTNRQTNRHRFVFFNKEIVASERHYVPHEPGVIPTSPPLVSAIAPSPSISSPASFHPMDPSGSPPSPSQFNNFHAQYPNYSSESVPLLPTPPPDSPSAMDYPSQTPQEIPPSPYQHQHHQHQHPNFPSFHVVTLKPERGKLRAGDLVYWHNLARNGEIPAVVEDESARHPLRTPWAGR